MDNIKNFEDFNSLNEGLISWAKDKFKVGELDDLIKDIINKIKSDFKISKLEFEPKKKGNQMEMSKYNVEKGTFLYTIGDDEIFVSADSLCINDDNITKHINKHYMIDLFKFFDKKNKETSKETSKEKSKDEVNKLKDKYSKKFKKDEDNDEE